MAASDISLIVSGFIQMHITTIFALIFLGIVIWYAIKNANNIKETIDKF